MVAVLWKPGWRGLLRSLASARPDGSGSACSRSMAARRSASGGYSMTRNTEPFFGGGRRAPRAMASALPRLSAGVRAVSHTSWTMALPLVRLNTCGVAASMMKTDLPAALWPVTTRRICFDMLPSRAQAGEQFLGRIGIRWETEFELRRFDGLAAFDTQKAVDLADVVAGARQQRLQILDLFERERRRRIAAMQRRCAIDASGEISRGGRINERVVPLQINVEIRIDQKRRTEAAHGQEQRCGQIVVRQRPAVGKRDAQRRPLGARQFRIEVGLVPRQLPRHAHFGEPRLAALPAKPDQIVRGRAEHVRHVVNEIASAVAV